MLVQAGADFLVGEGAAAVNLCQTLLDLPHEPIVLVQEALDGLARQRLCVGPAFRRKAGQLGLLLGREGNFHGPSLPELGRGGDRRIRSDPAGRRHASRLAGAPPRMPPAR